MYQLVLIIHVLIALAIIGLVLIQHGKGADIGAAFGSGASNTLFGSQGSGGFLFKMTGGLALAFFVTSLSLSSIVANGYSQAGQNALPLPDNTPVSQVPMPAGGK